MSATGITLYPRGTCLADVDPDARGVSLHEWKLLQVHWQCERYLAKLGPVEVRNAEAPLKSKRVWTPRDDYGMKGF